MIYYVVANFLYKFLKIIIMIQVQEIINCDEY